MSTISLYASQINQMPNQLRNVKTAVSDFKTELFALKKSTLQINASICNLNDVIDTITSSTRVQEKTESSINSFQKKTEQFIEEVVRIDNLVASTIKQRKDSFYSQYGYLKPECEKKDWQKFCDRVKTVKEWCQDNWKSIAKIALSIVIIAGLGIASLLTCGALSLILAGAFWGALAGGLLGGIMSGVSNTLNGGSFLDGLASGMLSGTITGAITGAAFTGIGLAGQALGKSISCLSTLGKTIKITSHVTKVLSLGMDGFDIVAMGIGLFDPNNTIVQLNQRAHSSTTYNLFQVGVNALAIFTGSAASSMNCFIAGTLVLTTSGLVAIENIKSGDKVISANPDTSEIAAKNVKQKFVSKTNKLVHIQVNNETISSTTTHPFYVKKHGWKYARDLLAGDLLMTSSGAYVQIEKVTIESLLHSTNVYNFEVEDFNTYFVGNSMILVHNTCIKPREGGVQNPDGTTTYSKEIDGKEISVTYNKEGYPDFSPYAETLPNGQKSVQIEYSGSRSKDFRLADKAAGYTSKNPRPAGTTWHHNEDMKTMQLIRSKIQNASQGGFPHSGGVEKWQKLTGIKYKP